MAKNFPGDLVSFEILSNGSPIPDRIQVLSIQIDQEVNQISKAIITIADGDPATGNFPVSASDTFIPGNEMEIKAGYDSVNQTLFKGIITKQTIRTDETNGSVLEVECMDKAVKMTVGRKSAVYKNIKDSDVFSMLIADAGLIAQVDSTSNVIAELVQYYVSDWDFMISRAEINSMVVSTINGKVVVFNPAQNSSPVLEFTYGEDLINFNLSLNAASQFAKVKASAWDYKHKKTISAYAPNNLPGPGNLSSKKLAEVIGLSEYELQTTAAVGMDEIDNWAKAQMLKSELSKITGSAQFQGTSVIQPGKYVTLEGLGPRFNGIHFASAVYHNISDGNWRTEIKIGLSDDWYVQKQKADAPAAGLIPGIQGLFNGIVKKIKDDPDSQNRILVDIPLFKGNGNGIWARLFSGYQTNVQSAVMPQIGDEVIVGYLNQDPRYPVILGGLNVQKKLNRKKLLIN